MQKIFKTTTLLIIMLGIFLLPISPGLEKTKVEAVKTAKAEQLPDINWSIPQITYDKTTKITTITETITSTNTTVNLDDIRALYMIPYILADGKTKPNDTDVGEIKPTEYPFSGGKNIPSTGLTSYSVIQHFNLNPGKYYIIFIITDGGYDPFAYNRTYQEITYDYTNNNHNIQGIPNSFTITDNETTGEIIPDQQNVQNTKAQMDFECGITNLDGCLAQIFYSFFKIAAWIATLAGKFLDFFIYYSISSLSYTSNFITKGWGAVRDIANIFFIIALLYIAIKTILGLNVTNNKKMIGTIVIVALLINFSLFFTQVIIDGSNILAKVFYNNIDSKYENKDPALGAKGEKSISVGLIDKFNPQNLVTIDVLHSEWGTSLFIFITLLAMITVLYVAWIFFTVAILFVGRVVSLWISMIFAPIAFASYTLPFDIPGLGHKEWWKNLFENAFLAPIFIFMLYLVVMFADFLKEIANYPEGADFMQKVMSTIIPFVILAALLMKAKDMAVKYAGEMGAAMNKAGAFLGGAAVGVTAGVAAIGGRAVIGRAGSAIANSNWAKSWEKAGWGGGAFRSAAKAAGKGSFDVRGVKVMGKDLSSTGLKVNTIGKPQEGGFEKMKTDKIEKRVKRAKELEMGEGTKDKREASALEADLRVAKAEKATELADVEKEISALREKMQDQKNGGLDTAATYLELENAKNRKAVIVGTKEEISPGTFKDIVDPSGKKIKRPNSIADFEKRLNQKNDEINAAEIKSMREYAKNMESMGNKTLNFVKTFGQHSGAGANIAADRIRKGVKIEETKK